MADITASGDLTVTISDQRILQGQRRNRCTVLLGTGGNDYPSGGIPMPTYDKLGMVRNVDFLVLFDESDADGYVWKYDKDNHKVRAYVQTPTDTGNIPLAEVTDGTALTTRSWGVEAVGW